MILPSKRAGQRVVYSQGLGAYSSAIVRMNHNDLLALTKTEFFSLIGSV
jgi:hypothetical protein